MDGDQLDYEDTDAEIWAAREKAGLIDFQNKRVSAGFTFMEAEMGDSDCSEDYENDPFFQQPGKQYFKILENFQQEQL